MSVAVIILNWNGCADTLECLHSLQSQTYTNFTPIVIDNGSTDDSIKAITLQFPNATLIENEDNLGFAAGNNVGIENAIEAGYDWVFLLNNDTVLESNCIENLVSAAQKLPRTILGAHLCQYGDHTRLDHIGGVWNPQRANFDLIGAGELSDDPQFLTPREVDFVCGAALFASADTFHQVGPLESRFFLVWEESDWCIRAKKLGYRVITCPIAKVYHKVSSSFVGGKPHTHYFWWRNRLLFMQRNLSPSEYREKLGSIIYPELKRILKHYLLKNLQRLLAPGNKQKRIQAKTYHAALRGALDFFTKRFGPPPPSIFRK